jgi:hypothetical protein
MAQLSDRTIRMYTLSWNYVKKFITDINNIEQTMNELKSIKHSSQQKKPITDYIMKNYILSVMHQLRDKPEIRLLYNIEIKKYVDNIKKLVETQSGTEKLRQKLSGTTWADIVKYRDAIVAHESITDENKLLIRMYVDMKYPVRNDYAGISVFIDEPRPATFEGNCIMLTRKPMTVKPRKTKPRIVKSTVELSTDECATAEFYPVRNIVWINDFKTSKTNPDIIQSIPDQLANDLIKHCIKNNTRTLFTQKSVKRGNGALPPDYAASKRINYMFYQVSNRRDIGINVLRHLKIMDEYKDTPMLHARKQTANMMGHSVNMQELYRLRID